MMLSSGLRREMLGYKVDSTYEGAVSATITVKFLSLNAAFKNASTVFECPTVKMISLIHQNA